MLHLCSIKLYLKITDCNGHVIHCIFVSTLIIYRWKTKQQVLWGSFPQQRVAASLVLLPNYRPCECALLLCEIVTRQYFLQGLLLACLFALPAHPVLPGRQPPGRHQSFASQRKLWLERVEQEVLMGFRRQTRLTRTSWFTSHVMPRLASGTGVTCLSHSHLP